MDVDLFSGYAYLFLIVLFLGWSSLIRKRWILGIGRPPTLGNKRWFYYILNDDIMLHTLKKNDNNMRTEK